MIIVAPLVINVFSIFLWFLHWHGYFKSLNLKIFSLSFMLLSFVLWLQLKGAEFGSIYFFLSTSITGLLFLVESKKSFKRLFNLHYSTTKRSEIKKSEIKLRKKSKIANSPRSQSNQPYKKSKFSINKPIYNSLKTITNLILLVLTPFITAASFSLLIPTIFGHEDVNTLVTSLLVFLLTWSLLLTWVYMKSKRFLAHCLLTLTSILILATFYSSSVHSTNNLIIKDMNNVTTKLTNTHNVNNIEFTSTSHSYPIIANKYTIS